MKTKAHCSKRWQAAPGILACAFLSWLAGCASGGRETIPISSVGVSQTADYGTVVDVRLVNIEGSSTAVGTGVGATAGGAIGSTVGNTSTSAALGAAGGMVVGAVIAPQIEKALTRKVAQEVVIERDEGYSQIVVVHLGMEPEFQIGDKVAVYETRAGEARVRLVGRGDDRANAPVYLPPADEPWEENSW